MIRRISREEARMLSRRFHKEACADEACKSKKDEPAAPREAFGRLRAPQVLPGLRAAQLPRP